MIDSAKILQQSNKRRTDRTGFHRFGIAIIVMAAMLVAGTVPADAGSRTKGDVMNQGGEGVYAANGATLNRGNRHIHINWRVPTPEPGSYAYPTADMIPPTAPPHPEVLVGYPEVYTLWVFIFNNPELCDLPCDGNDIGDTPAQGGVYQLDYTIGFKDTIRMNGKIKVGATPANGSVLQDPHGADVHVAMAPHGQAYTGDDLVRQFSGPIGSPPFWWAAIFE